MRHCDRAFDAHTDEAPRVIEDKARAELLGRAIDLARDVALVPL
jgi:hypothetical protein